MNSISPFDYLEENPLDCGVWNRGRRVSLVIVDLISVAVLILHGFSYWIWPLGVDPLRNPKKDGFKVELESSEDNNLNSLKENMLSRLSLKFDFLHISTNTFPTLEKSK